MNPMTQRRILVVPGRLTRHITYAWGEAHAEQRRRDARERAAREQAAAEAAAAVRAAEEAARLARCPRPDKLAWGTREGALDSVRTMREKGRDPHHTLNPYRCICGSWHIGNVRNGAPA